MEYLISKDKKKINSIFLFAIKRAGGGGGGGGASVSQSLRQCLTTAKQAVVLCLEDPRNDSKRGLPESKVR